MQYTALYFSASYCGPCLQFTPKLITMYDKFLEKSCDIVFISSDKDEDSYNDYFAKMPWKTTAYDLQHSHDLRKKYNVLTIPTLIITDTLTKTIINRNARNLVLCDNKLEKFPWPVNNIFDNLVELTKNIEEYELAEIKTNKAFGLYFSDLNNRNLNNKVVLKYNKLRRIKQPFEIIFISKDKNYINFMNTIENFPFVILDFEKVYERENLVNIANISKIPSLAIFDDNGDFITNDGLDDFLKN